MKALKIFKTVFASPGEIWCSMFYSGFVTVIALIFIPEAGIAKFIFGVLMAIIASISALVQFGVIMKYKSENKTLAGFRKMYKMPAFFNFIWGISIILFFLILTFFYPIMQMSFGVPIGLASGMIITTISATILLKTLPWKWKP